MHSLHFLSFSFTATDVAVLGRGEDPGRHLHSLPQEGPIPLAQQERPQCKCLHQNYSVTHPSVDIDLGCSVILLGQ